MTAIINSSAWWYPTEHPPLWLEPEEPEGKNPRPPPNPPPWDKGTGFQFQHWAVSIWAWQGPYSHREQNWLFFNLSLFFFFLSCISLNVLWIGPKGTSWERKNNNAWEFLSLFSSGIFKKKLRPLFINQQLHNALDTGCHFISALFRKMEPKHSLAHSQYVNWSRDGDAEPQGSPDLTNPLSTHTCFFMSLDSTCRIIHG